MNGESGHGLIAPFKLGKRYRLIGCLHAYMSIIAKTQGLFNSAIRRISMAKPAQDRQKSQNRQRGLCRLQKAKRPCCNSLLMPLILQKVHKCILTHTQGNGKL